MPHARVTIKLVRANGFAANLRLNKNDFVFADTSEDIDGAGNFVFNDYPNNIFAGYHDVVARPHDLEYPPYLAALFSSFLWKRQIQSLVNGVKVYSINKTFLKNSRILLPSIEEQKEIFTYTTKKTAQIDRFISETEKKIEKLNELKQAQIAHLVTHGLNSDASMKDSGIVWIGQIPEHWEVSKIRKIFKLANEKTEEKHARLLSLSQYTGIQPKDKVGKVGMFEAETTTGYNVVHKGQFVMNIMLAWNGSYAVSDFEGVISPAYCVYDFRIECEKKYFDYLLRLKVYAGAFKTLSRGIIDSRLRLYPEYFKTFPVIIPPLEEQKSIVNAIDSLSNRIDTLTSELTHQIDNLKELKQRIISDAVTGKIDVREANN